MKNSMLVVVGSILAVQVFAATPPPPPGMSFGKQEPMTKSEKHRQEVYERRIAKAGGLITSPVRGKVVQVVNAQKRVSTSELREMFEPFERMIELPVEIVDGTKDAALAASNVGLVVEFCECDKSPTLLVAPEDRWATVNVTKLAKGDPEKALLKKRMTREFWRAMAYSLGCGYSKFNPCVMRDIFSVEDLDRCEVSMASPELYPQMGQSAVRHGILPVRTMTYRDACEEGWAPQPTNEVQKAIWDKVHTLPTEPIRILPKSQKK